MERDTSGHHLGGTMESVAGKGKIRVLVVDDSVVVRRIITDTLLSDAGLEVAGVAANGRLALDRIPQLKPDVVTLDIEMPEMDGLETLRHLRADHPHLPVIMFSTLTERGAASTLDALSLGASDYVTKPANCGSVGASVQMLREQLIPKVKAVARRKAGHLELGRMDRQRMPARTPVPASQMARLPDTGFRDSEPAVRQPTARVRETAPARHAARQTRKPDPQAVLLGVSTGGPNALATVIPQLPADLPLPVLVVQHMPPMFTRLLAERLDSTSAIAVKEAADGERARAGCVYIAPGDYHMEIQRQGFQAVIRLQQEAPQNSCRPAVDVLFRSARQCFGSAVVAAVLTGMGEDGLRGATSLREAGATILAQDEATSVVWGMPGFVVRAGLAERVLPIGEIAAAIVALASPGKEVSP